MKHETYKNCLNFIIEATDLKLYLVVSTNNNSRFEKNNHVAQNNDTIALWRIEKAAVIQK